MWYWNWNNCNTNFEQIRVPNDIVGSDGYIRVGSSTMLIATYKK